MVEDNPKYEVMSTQKLKRGEKTSPYAQRLKQVRDFLAKERGLERLSQVKFAGLLEVHPSTVSHIEAGTTRIQPDLARVIEEKTGFSQAWLLTGLTPQRVGGPFQLESREGYTQFEFSYVKKVKPLLSGGSGELVIEEESEDIYSFRRDWLSRKGAISSMRLAQVSGDSMLPTLSDGDFVLFDTSKRYPLDGKIMVVGIDNLLYIKRVRRTPEGTFLVSDNRAVYEPWRIELENSRFLGLVIWHCGEV